MSADKHQAPAVPDTPLTVERRRLMKDALVNNLAAPVSAVVGLLLVPFMLRALGQDNYGLWIVATSISGILVSIDLGLGWGVCRVVAADPSCGEGDTSDIVGSAANVYVFIGVTGCIVLGGAGLLSSGSLHLPPVQHGTAIMVFWLVGATLCADQVNAFGFAVLSGLRRFKLINVIASLASIAWAVGAVAILMNGGSVAAVAACQLAVAMLRSIWTLWLVARLNPKFRFRLGFFKWDALRRHVSFAASSLMTTALSAIAWGSAPVLIGFISGSAAAVPFYVGQKFPVAVSGMSWRAAEVLFPAATETRHDIVKSGEVLRVGSRWVLVLAVPLAVLMLVFAPHILHAWLGAPPPGSVTVLRILAATALADAVAAASVHLFWGRGAMRPILLTYVGQGIGVVALTLGLVYKFGVTGAAWGMLIPISSGAIILFVAASRACSVSAWNLATEATHGLAMPVLACAVSAYVVLNLGGNSRLWVVAGLVLGVLMYLATLFWVSGNNEEKQFAKDTLSRLKEGVGMRKLIRRIPGYQHASYLYWTARVQWFKDRKRMSDDFHLQKQWNFESDIEQQRHELVLAAVARLMPEISKAKVLELGCSDGVFTARLAMSCASVTACDLSSVARELAARRCQEFNNVFIREFDLAHEAVPGGYDIIFAMDVFEYVHGMNNLRAVVKGLTDALHPRGLLVFSSCRLSPVLRNAWWQRWLPEGADAVLKFIASNPALRMEHSEFHPADGSPIAGYLAHAIAVFRKSC